MNWIDKIPPIDTLIILLLFISLVALALAREQSPELFTKFFELPINPSFLVISRRLGLLSQRIHLWLFMFQFINLGLFGVLIVRQFWDDYWDKSWTQIYFWIMVYLVVKTTLQLVNAYFFKSWSQVWLRLHDKLTFQSFGALFLFFGNLLFLFVFPGTVWVLWVSGILFFVFQLQGWIGILRLEQKRIILRPHYFILYICTLEIAPAIILTKFII